MKNDRKQKLIDLGPDVLADALLNLAVHSDEADELIEQLIATPKENVQRFKKKLSGLKRSKRFISWHESASFGRELSMLLQDLKSGVDDPLTGIELVAAFYEADSTIFEMCDDSSGNIGDVCRHDAKELFVDYAKCCEEKPKIADIILKINKKDNYGIRDTLIDCAGECLPEDVIRTMITTLQKWADKELERGYTKAYPHGIRYLKKLDKLAASVADWKKFHHHEAFKEQIIEAHGRKRSFWSKYGVLK